MNIFNKLVVFWGPLKPRKNDSFLIEGRKKKILSEKKLKSPQKSNRNDNATRVHFVRKSSTFTTETLHF